MQATGAQGVQIGDGNVQINNFFTGTGLSTAAQAGGVGDLGRVRPGPWRVFLSHTGELSQFPADDSFVAAARRAVERAGHAVVEMGTWTAADIPSSELDARKLADSDVYVGLLGFRYGMPTRKHTSRSYTEAEFDTAASLGLPRLVFLLADELDVAVPRSFYSDPDFGDRQEAFRARAQAAGVTGSVTSPKDLELMLFQALTELADAATRRAALPPEGARDREPGARWSSVFAVPPRRLQDVARTGLSAQVLEHLLAADPSEVVAMTTGLVGAGGFGKTTLARMLVHDPATTAAFPDGIVWVTVGQGLAGPELAERINDLSATLSGDKPLLTEPLLAGVTLGQRLGDRQMLLVIDDVWSTTQMEPFLIGGPNTVRLVTTRQHGVMPPGAVTVHVDAMDPDEATGLLTTGLLTTGLREVPSQLVDELLAVTGRWPVLLGLVNGAARIDTSHGASPARALTDIRDQFQADGITALDVADPDQRDKAVSATLDVSLARLTPAERDRFTELAIFGEDVDVPLSVLARYWQHTGSWSSAQTRTLCRRLSESSLLATYRVDPPPRIRLHDVICDYLRHLCSERLPALHSALLDAHRDLVTLALLASGNPHRAWWQRSPDDAGASPRDPMEADGAMAAATAKDRRRGRADWAELPTTERYLWESVPTHMRAAGLTDELAATVSHRGWLMGKLELVGPAGLEADLGLANSPITQSLSQIVRQGAHLLAPLDPPGSLAATLAARLPAHGELDLLRVDLQSISGSPLVPDTRFPDVAETALFRTLAGPLAANLPLGAAPSGNWIAAATDQSVTIWNILSGKVVRRLTGHSGTVNCIAAAGDGKTLVSASTDSTIRIWDPASGVQTNHLTTAHEVKRMAVSHSGERLAYCGHSDVTVWNLAGKYQLDVFALPEYGGRGQWVKSVALSPDGQLLAVGGSDSQIRVWSLDGKAESKTLQGHDRYYDTVLGGVTCLSFDPTGRTLASGASDGKVILWSTKDWTELRVLSGHGADELRDSFVNCLSFSADGQLLVTGGGDGRLVLWEACNGGRQSVLTEGPEPLARVTFVSGNRFVASTGADRTVRLWEVPNEAEAAQPCATRRHLGLRSVAVHPAGHLVAVGDRAGAVKVLPLEAGSDRSLRAPIEGRMIRVAGVEIMLYTAVNHLAFSPDGSWLAAEDPPVGVSIFDTSTWVLKRNLQHLTWGDFDLLVLLVFGRSNLLASVVEHAVGRSTLMINNLDAGECVAYGEYRGRVGALSFSHEDRHLEFADSRGCVEHWAFGEQECPTGADGSLGAANSGPAFAVSANRKLLASVDSKGIISIWEYSTRQKRGELVGHSEGKVAIAFHPGGGVLASAGVDGLLRLWDADRYQGTAAMRVGSPLHAVTWHPDGNRVIAVGDAGVYSFSCHLAL